MKKTMGFAKTYAGVEPQRVNKWLAQSGVCSRREAESFIEQGLVFIDGRRIEDPGHKIAPGQTLTLAEEAREAGALLVDLFAQIPHDDLLLHADGFHPNDVGHREIAALFLEAIRPIVKAPLMGGAQD